MKIDITNFEGEYPRIGEQVLALNAATVAQNTRLLSGNITAWNGLELETALSKVGTINTVYLMDDQYWLHWVTSELGAGQVSVDVAKMPRAQDTTERTIFTGTDVPRVTNISLATTGMGTDYPIDSFKLGVPAPANAPTLTVTSNDAAPNEIVIDNGDAEDGVTISDWHHYLLTDRIYPM